MHDYMRAIGFSYEISRESLKKLLSIAVRDSDEDFVVSEGEDILRVEYFKLLGKRVGLIVRGTIENVDGTDEIFIDYSVPYLKPIAISSTEKISFTKYAEKESYVGICDDYRLGMPLIFYLQNMNSYLAEKDKYENRVIDILHLSLSALSLEGSVMMPIEKDHVDIEEERRKKREWENLQRKAKQGDDEALESLTIRDMDTYSLVRKRVQSEDVYSLVDSYVMPFGIENDQYSILGEIKDVEEEINSITGEELYILDIVANDIFFNVCIHKDDLIGEPEIGRRFKGVIWMQGNVAF